VDARWQRSTVKASYSRNGRSASWAAHGTYLAREGAQREGGKGRGFSAEREGIDLTATLRGWQRAGDARLWKFIVSPEHAERLDLKAHTRALVSHMERDLGTRLEWVAIDHYNTDNPHVHLLVRGRDARGQALQIHPDYLKQGIRRRSQDLATQVLGYRSEREIVQSRGQAVERLRFTEIDRALIRHGGTRGLVTIDGPTPKAPAARAFRQQELRRLQMLEDLGLAEKVWTRTWRLSPQLETALRQAQLSGDIIKARARHQARLSDPRLPVTVTRIEAGTVITGRVIGTGLADELRDQRYLLVESRDRLHYIPQPAAVQRARGRGQLRIGDVVTLRGEAIEKGVRVMVETRVQALEPGQVQVPRRGRSGHGNRAPQHLGDYPAHGLPTPFPPDARGSVGDRWITVSRAVESRCHSGRYARVRGLMMPTWRSTAVMFFVLAGALLALRIGPLYAPFNFFIWWWRFAARR